MARYLALEESTQLTLNGSLKAVQREGVDWVNTLNAGESCIVQLEFTVPASPTLDLQYNIITGLEKEQASTYHFLKDTDAEQGRMKNYNLTREFTIHNVDVFKIKAVLIDSSGNLQNGVGYSLDVRIKKDGLPL